VHTTSAALDVESAVKQPVAGAPTQQFPDEAERR